MSAWGVIIDTVVKGLTMAAHTATLVEKGGDFVRWVRGKVKANDEEMGLPRTGFGDRMKEAAEEGLAEEFRPLLTELAADRTRIAALEQKIVALEASITGARLVNTALAARVNQLEQRCPQDLPVRLGALESNVPAGLDRRLTHLEGAIPSLTHRRG
ncbi:hypothetical protein BKA60DRAFT_545265 [Fusarium oxysporum]|uniref:Uncharacterized protein n=1 Tax=Fusarium oxysporum TaxID=5507 RepID=A0A420NGV1_FUSOX|nr:hypothetical protein BKA60DRAFT_545265 [Fusarium oxysporum]RKK79508.1 hypothetical protein BFJ69_g4936 [Fusarium oxysporum]